MSQEKEQIDTNIISEQNKEQIDTNIISEENKEQIDSNEKSKSISKNSKIIPGWKIGILLFFLVFSTILTAMVIWASCHFDEIFIDEILWHLRTSLKGTDPKVVSAAVTAVLAGITVILVPSLILFLKTRKKGKIGKRIYRGFQILTSVILITGLVIGYFRFNVQTFIKSHFVYSKFIEQEYVDPGTVELKFPEKKRNLIIIYMESMEVTFMDKENGGAFKENVIPELTALAEENEDFSGNSGKTNGGIALPFMVWTMGAVFGTTSGLPLKTPLGQNGMYAKDDFFPSIITLGDILEEEGYQNVLVMGSDSDFGGCNHYFRSHGNYVIHDYVYAKKAGLVPKDYRAWWGYEDEKLFEFAKADLTELSKNDQPFHMVLQTMDTHSEDGYKCRLCRDDFGKDKYSNVINCSSRMVDSFISWIQEQDFYEDTTIIIMGDHPTMDTDYCDKVPKSYQRKVYTCIINPAIKPADPDKERAYATIDIFPTALAAIGVDIDGDRLGLGTDLFSEKETLIEKYGLEKVEDKFNCGSKLMEKMFNGIYKSPSKSQKQEK
ncbi:phosphoglycerol transferase [Eubacterium ruminantium]|nr:phosphoglycerol transferase [Eubacterium ruminantium]